MEVFFKGLWIGGTMTVPGVSGGTMAILVGIYDRLIGAVSGLVPKRYGPENGTERSEKKTGSSTDSVTGIGQGKGKFSWVAYRKTALKSILFLTIFLAGAGLGMLLFAKLMGKMLGGKKKGEKAKPMGFEMTPELMSMMNGFTVLRLLTMAGGMMNAEFTKEDLLNLNKKLNRIRRPKEKK